MPRVTQASLMRLQDSIDIIDLISYYIDVRKVGANYVALCPFHDDKTPSMSISATKGLYHCFACGASGNAIKFVMEYEKLEFYDAIQKIANFFNIALEYERGETKQKSHLLPSLSNFYHNELFKHDDIMQYLSSRSVSMDSIKEFEIGYSGMSYETIRFINENNLNYQEAIDFGILTQGNDRAYARFSNRIIFPIKSSNGMIVGFGGRTISNEKNVAKYLNSPQSKIFNKSKILYGYNIAKQMIYKQKSIIVCEGYLDVIMLHQAGFRNAVATLGTALNEGHLYLLNKENPRIYVCYDGDNAGINAALKAAKLLSKNSKDGGVIILQNGLDPADMVAQNKIEEFKYAIKTAKPFIEFVLEKIIAQFDLQNPIQKQQALKECNEYLNSLTLLLQDEYKKKCALLLNINPSLIITKNINKKNQELKNPINYLQNNNFAEETILYNMLVSQEHKNFALHFLDKKYFSMYGSEFELICKSDYDNDKINALKFKAKNEILSNDKFKEQLRFFILEYAQKLLPKIFADKSPAIDKLQKINTIKKGIERLKAGELLII